LTGVNIDYGKGEFGNKNTNTLSWFGKALDAVEGIED
jgi:hypothetical protein